MKRAKTPEIPADKQHLVNMFTGTLSAKARWCESKAQLFKTRPFIFSFVSPGTDKGKLLREDIWYKTRGNEQRRSREGVITLISIIIIKSRTALLCKCYIQTQNSSVVPRREYSARNSFIYSSLQLTSYSILSQSTSPFSLLSFPFTVSCTSAKLLPLTHS